MKRLLFALALLLAPSGAAANAQFDLLLALQNLRSGRDADALYWLNRTASEHGLKGAALADVLEWRAFLHVKRNDLRAARADLDAAVAADNDNPMRYRARARFFLRNGDFRAALADMEAVFSRVGSDAENFSDHCEALLGLGRRAETVVQCRKAIQVNPEYARPKLLLRRAQGR
jgi:tetratricopeptide (TPR) repeat protein